MSHQVRAREGIASRMAARMSADEGCASAMTHAHVKRPCVSPRERQRLLDDVGGRGGGIDCTQDSSEEARGQRPQLSPKRYRQHRTVRARNNRCRDRSYRTFRPIAARGAHHNQVSGQGSGVSQDLGTGIAQPDGTADAIIAGIDAAIAPRSFTIIASRSTYPAPASATPSGTTTWTARSSAVRARAIAFAHFRAFIERSDKSVGQRT